MGKLYRQVLFNTFLILFVTSSFAQQKQVCFTIDDLPVVSYGIDDTCYQRAVFEKLISSLITNKIPAIGFVIGKKLFRNDSLIHFQYGLLKSWVDCGLDLGNHTYSHPDYNNVTLEQYIKDILAGEVITREILNCRGKSIKYFRHPLLHTGNIKEKSDSLNEFLLSHNYTTAPVTIDNDDYLFALAYKRASVNKDSSLMVSIGTDYITYMQNKLLYFEKQSYKLFGRNIKQVLLLHASLLNADYLDSLAAMFRKNNYDFVSMDEAIRDEVYKTEVTFYGNWGISWIDRWALSRGLKGDFFKDEPATPDYIKELSK